MNNGNLIGRELGRFVILKDLGMREYDNPKYPYLKRHYVLAKCECGNVKPIRLDSIKRKSKCKACVAIKHGKSYTPEYNSWSGMIQRCTNSKKDKYKYYGGRGIKVCERWLYSFENFIFDMGLKPTPQHSIDRVNNDGDYEPSNCRWATRSEQMKNSRKRESKKTLII